MFPLLQNWSESKISIRISSNPKIIFVWNSVVAMSLRWITNTSGLIILTITRSRISRQRFWKSYCHSERSLSIGRKRSLGQLSCATRQFCPELNLFRLCHLGGGSAASDPRVIVHQAASNKIDPFPMWRQIVYVPWARINLSTSFVAHNKRKVKRLKSHI